MIELASSPDDLSFIPTTLSSAFELASVTQDRWYETLIIVWWCELNHSIRDIGSGAADLCKQQPNLARFKVTTIESVWSYKFHEDSR